MDALSRLLSLYPIHTALDTRYRVAAPWRVNHVAQDHGTAPYHLVVEGTAWLALDGREPIQLAAGDMLVLPRGHAHALHVGGINGSPDGALADILCGQFHFGEAAAGALISALPDLMLIRTAAMLAAPDKAWTMAQLCHMSRSTFLRAFRKTAASMPGELLTRIRMAQAAQWLKQAHRGVAEISEAAGYQSEAAFNRAFKRHMGASPGQYRRALFA